jgi:hypothetical protein
MRDALESLIVVLAVVGSIAVTLAMIAAIVGRLAS